MNKKLTVTIVLLLIFLGNESVLNADLIAHWKGDGDASDSSGNGHSGTLMNGTSFATGVLGQGFEFDGVNDFVSIAGDPSLMPSNITVAAWINVAPSNSLRLVADSSHGGPGNAGGWAFQVNASNQISFAYGNGSSFPEVSSSASVADNTFRHVAATLDGSDIRIYVDGTLDASLAYSGSPSPSGANMGNIHLGNHFLFNRPLNGILDDVRIYDEALSASQISALASVPEPSSIALIALSSIAILGRRNRKPS